MNNFVFVDPPLHANWEDPNQDLTLLKSCSMDILDMERTAQGVRLKKIPFGQRVSRFFSLSGKEKEQERQHRLEEYVSSACEHFPNNLNANNRIDFYKNLRKWSIFNAGKLSQAVRERLSPVYAEACQAVQVAKDIFGASKKRARAEWDLKRAEVMLAQDLGIPFKKTGGGVNGAQIAYGLNGNPLLIIKKSGEDRRLIAEEILGQRRQINVCRHDPREAGAIAFMADEYFAP